MDILTNEQTIGYNALDMKKKLIVILCLSAVIASVMYGLNRYGSCMIVAVAFSTVFFHIAMRLGVYCGIRSMPKSDFDFDGRWFGQKKAEGKIYRMICVHAWKNVLPHLFPEDFALSSGIEKVVRSTCIAEIAHTIIIPLSYLPAIFALLMRADIAYLIALGASSVIAGFADFLMLIIQRYNRPRLLRAAEHLRLRNANKVNCFLS